VATTYGYDALDRPVTTAFGGSGGTVTRTYDAGDRPTKIDDSKDGVATFAYDGLDRLSSATTPQGKVAYGYDAADRRTSMTAAGQPKVTYAYDPADDLTGVRQSDDKVTLSYDAASRLTRESLPGGVAQSYAYDPAGQATGVTYGKLGSLGYTYDPSGNVAGLSGSFARTTVPRSVQASYDAGDQLVKRGTTGYTYDADGQMTRAGATSYTWDARGQLTGLKGTGTTASFAYDALGRRVQKTVNKQTTGYLYDGLNPVREEGDGVGWNLLSGGTDQFFLRSQTAPGSGSAAPKVYRPSQTFLTDALGSTLALTDDQGSVQAEYTYDPFGATTASGNDEDNPFRFTGREDDGTGLYYDRARYYSPGDQRFTSQDPIGLASGDTNPYTYTDNDPADLTDPLGTKPDDTNPPDPCTPNSLTDDTGVLMADGTRKPIKDVRAGDRVRTVDPATGKTVSRRVDTIITGAGDKTLTRITVATGHGTKTLTATDNHPFWVTGTGEWTDAGDLRPGMRLRTPSGSSVEVGAVHTYAAGGQHVRNLTVDGTHTYFADAGGTPVLVHNETGVPGQPPEDYVGRHQAETPLDYLNGETRGQRLITAIEAGYDGYTNASTPAGLLPESITSHPAVAAVVNGGRAAWGLWKAVRKYNELAVHGKHRSETQRGRHAKGHVPAAPEDGCGTE
jgi:RHS repeat-associated protein